MWSEGRLGLSFIIDDGLLFDHVVQCELKVQKTGLDYWANICIKDSSSEAANKKHKNVE